MDTTLKQWMEQVEWIFNHIDVGVHLVDNMGTTVFYNQTMGKIDGIEPRQALGKNFLHLFPSLTHETSTLNHVLRTGESVIEKTQSYVNLTGKQITTINSTYPLYSREGVKGAVEIARDITRIVELHDQVLDLRRQLRESSRGKRLREGSVPYHFSDLIGENPAFRQAVSIAKKASRSQSPVIIYGATGTGKDLIAQSIHNASIRRERPFVAQNCAAVPRDLMEGLMFGTTKGAFTGSIDRPGIFEQADEGTLFLDELNSLDPSLQSKLLRVLQDGKIRRIGATKEQEVNVRIIAAMNIPPSEALEKGIIRSDLYFRLNVVAIHLPPLDERKEDIPLLIQDFIDKCNRSFGTSVSGISNSTLQKLMGYNWPGNIRELHHAIESAFNMMELQNALIEEHHLPPYLLRHSPPLAKHPAEFPSSAKKDGFSKINLSNMLEQIEQDAIMNALREHHGNVSRAAEALSLSRQALQYKIGKYRLNGNR